MTYGNALAILADPTRRHIYERLAKQPRNVSQLAEGMSVSRPAVSQHLKALKDADLITLEKHGNQNIYSARPEALGELRQYIDRVWEDILDSYSSDEDDGR